MTLKISDSNELGIATCKAGWKGGPRMAQHFRKQEQRAIGDRNESKSTGLRTKYRTRDGWIGAPGPSLCSMMVQAIEQRGWW
jgi:hypothetical protein